MKLLLSGILAATAVLLVAGGPALAQGLDDRRPFLPNEEEFGRNSDNGTLRYCLDPRDPEWEVAAPIAEAIAAALLLEPAPVMISDEIESAGWTTLFAHLMADCDLYFGFKLIPSAYPPWAALTRAFYDSTYVLAVEEPAWASLGDIPTSEAIATAIATTADFAFVKYIETQPGNARWRRFPMAGNAALDAVLNGTAAAALVWGPTVWHLQRTDPTYAGLRLIDTAPLPPTTLGMGAILRSEETYLRAAVDEAIAALITDGTIASILAELDFPGRVPALP